MSERESSWWQTNGVPNNVKGSGYPKSGGLYDFSPGPLHPQQMTISGVSVYSH